MNTSDRRPAIAWLILVYDRTAEVRFPLERKQYRFSYARATEREAQEVIQLCTKERKPLQTNPGTEIGMTRISYRLGAAGGIDRRILQYRHLFDYLPESDEEQIFSEDQCRDGFTSVSLSSDYFEDENQKPITLVQILNEETKRRRGGNAFAIVMNEPESILRCGPVQPIRPELWHDTDADLVTHLFDVYRQLRDSRWLKSECVVSPDPEDTLLPIREDCMAVILPFRQLYSKNAGDDLFNRCCKVHACHCPSSHPIHRWVEEYKAQFNAFLEDPVTSFLNGCTLVRRRYLDAFAYGAKVVHANSRTSTPTEDWNYLRTSFPKEMILMAYHSTLRRLLYIVSMAVTVMWQSVNHWINECGWAGNMRTGTANPFEI